MLAAAAGSIVAFVLLGIVGYAIISVVFRVAKKRPPTDGYELPDDAQPYEPADAPTPIISTSTEQNKDDFVECPIESCRQLNPPGSQFCFRCKAELRR